MYNILVCIKYYGTPCTIYRFVLNIMEHHVQYMGLDKRVWHSSITFSKLLNQGFQEIRRFHHFPTRDIL